MTNQQNKYIVLYDGNCSFCIGAKNFIAERDTKGVFQLIPQDDDAAKELIRRYQIPPVDSLILIKNDTYYLKSDALFETMKELSPCLYMMSLLQILPLPLRDLFYDKFAQNRYFFAKFKK